MSTSGPRTKPESELDDNRLETVRDDAHNPGEEDLNNLAVEDVADSDSGDALRP